MRLFFYEFSKVKPKLPPFSILNEQFSKHPIYNVRARGKKIVTLYDNFYLYLLPTKLHL